MKRFTCLLAIVSLLLLFGCNRDSQPADADLHAGHNHAPGEVCDADHESDHDADHDADHAGETPEEHAAHSGAEAGHSHTVGPKGGQLAILGSHEFHVELIKNADGAFEAYLYDPDFKPVKTDAKALNFVYMVDGKPTTVAFAATEEDGKFLPDANASFSENWNRGASVMTKINSIPYNQKMTDPE